MADELTTRVLLRRCEERPPDESAWQEFVRRYHSVIRGTVAKVFHLRVSQELERRPQFSRDSIEDLVQTVYLRLVEDNSRVLRAFHGELENSLPAYLSIISANVVKDHFREIKAGKRPKITFSLDEPQERDGAGGFFKDPSCDTGGKKSGAQGHSFTIDDIDALLKKALSQSNRDRNILIFKLRYLDGMTLAEIRSTLGLDMSPLGIGSILSRTNKRMRQIIEKKSDLGE